MSSDENSNFLDVSSVDGVTTITLGRPDAGNAITREVMLALIEAAESIHGDVDARAVILRAEGKHFSVGADLKNVESHTPGESLLKARRNAELGARLLRRIRDIPQPTICAIQGVATGAGACLAACCDFRLAAENARIGYGEVRMGINLMWRALPDVVELVGPARAKQLVMSGKLFSADQMRTWGYIDEVCPEPELHVRAVAWAREYAALPPIAVQMIKRSINRYSQPLGEAIMHMDGDQWLLSMTTSDSRECLRAFREKREPDLKGR